MKRVIISILYAFIINAVGVLVLMIFHTRVGPPMEWSEVREWSHLFIGLFIANSLWIYLTMENYQLSLDKWIKRFQHFIYWVKNKNKS